MKKYKVKVGVLVTEDEVTHLIDFQITTEAANPQEAIDHIKKMVGDKEMHISEVKLLRPYAYKVKIPS